MITKSLLKIAYVMLGSLALWLGFFHDPTWSALATQDAPAADPWRPTTAPKASSDGFILIRGGTFFSGDVVTRRGRQELARIEDFEMADHPVTNLEYKRFIDSTGFAPPLHWTEARAPARMENHPVVFVNRYDVDAYLAWRSRTERRVYRLPIWRAASMEARGRARRFIFAVDTAAALHRAFDCPILVSASCASRRVARPRFIKKSAASQPHHRVRAKFL